LSESDAVLSPEEKLLWCNLGNRIKVARQERGWTREQVIQRLPTPIVDRTLLSYEHGTRRYTVARLAEIAIVLGEAPGDILNAAAREARAYHMIPMRVDLAAIARDRNGFAALSKWAKSKLVEPPRERYPVLVPLVIQTLATMVEKPSRDLVRYLAQFIITRTPQDTP
jgi:transcriptional regulator with XRE-family HTH domain